MRWITRAVGIAMIFLTFRLTLWVASNLNLGALWLSLPFAGANVMLLITTALVTINNWSVKIPLTRLVEEGEEPKVAIIIPTRGETPAMVLKTVASVLAEDYPEDKMLIIVSDDAHNAALRFLVSDFKRKRETASIVYFEPAHFGSKERKGDAKAGNLNAVLEFLKNSPVEYVETRDADDCVGDKSFLRQCIGQLVANPKLAFVQTVKEAQVSKGDPFNNLEPFFYRAIMLAKNASNSVFPCGSGVVFRRKAIETIGGFPTWNLVEDLQTGIEMLARGWHGMYLPIVGTVSQVPPEDVPNVFKQRGTWALDTMRLFFWRNPLFQKGLNLRQKLAFLELGFFYLLSFVTLFFITVPIISLVWNIYPLVTNQWEYIANFYPQAMAIEVFFALLVNGMSFEKIWRSRQMWIGFSPVYAKACIVAFLHGPKKKPQYTVTRKQNFVGWYWSETLPQTILLISLAAVSIVYILRQSVWSLLNEADLGSVFWACFFIVGLASIVRKSWHRYEWRENPVVREIFTPRYALATMVLVILMSVSAIYLVTANQPAIAIEPEKVVAANVVPTPEVAAAARPILRVPEFGEPSKYTPPNKEQREASRALSQQKPLMLNPNGKVGLGIYTNIADNDFQATKDFETLVNHKMYYTSWFQSWGDTDKDFATSRVKLAAQNGYVPVITWEPWKRNFLFPTAPQPAYSFASINAGNHDVYIRSWAKAAATTKVPIVVRFAHEQSTKPGVVSWYPWQGDPEGYKAAFRRIVSIFRNEGATNVQFLWSAMWIYDESTALYYPGADVVDYVGTTTINHGTAAKAEWAEWRSFFELLGGQYKVAEDKWGKPFIVTELATAEQGGNKAQWLTDTFMYLKDYPRIVGVILLEVKQDREWPTINWSVASSEKALGAFKEVITNNDYFK